MGRTITGTGYFIAKKMGKAINDYDMIKEGDRIIVGVSGGKDSLTLLTLLHERKRWVPIDYDILAVHIQTDYRCRNCIHVETLKRFFEERGYKYYMESINILKNPDGTTNQISCFWCSWNRRKALFTLADRFNCNKVAFGHHRDDIVETILMNLFFEAEISAMSPKVSMFGGKLQIIRPLAYVEEKDIIRFAKEQGFPSNLCACPNGQLSQRKKMKEVIRDLEKICPHVKNNIFNSLTRIKKDYLV